MPHPGILCFFPLRYQSHFGSLKHRHRFCVLPSDADGIPSREMAAGHQRLLVTMWHSATGFRGLWGCLWYQMWESSALIGQNIGNPDLVAPGYYPTLSASLYADSSTRLRARYGLGGDQKWSSRVMAIAQNHHCARPRSFTPMELTNQGIGLSAFWRGS